MSENISVSEERLRLILAEFKLELFDRLGKDLAAKANVADVEALKATVKGLEAKVTESENLRGRILPEFENMQADVRGLKSAAADASAVSRYKRAVYVAVTAVIGAVGGLIGYAVQAAT